MKRELSILSKRSSAEAKVISLFDTTAEDSGFLLAVDGGSSLGSRSREYLNLPKTTELNRIDFSIGKWVISLPCVCPQLSQLSYVTREQLKQTKRKKKTSYRLGKHASERASERERPGASTGTDFVVQWRGGVALVSLLVATGWLLFGIMVMMTGRPSSTVKQVKVSASRVR